MNNIKSKKTGKEVKINFGSGTKIYPGFINVDQTKEYGAQVACNLEQFPYPFKDNYADFIVCEMVLEHLLYPTKSIEEFHRIIKPNGTVKIIVPHFSGLNALSADIHIRQYGMGYFYSYLLNNKGMFEHTSTKVWEQTKVKFKDVNIKLIFPKGMLTILSFPFQILFGSNRRMQGIYEHFFSNFYRCNEIHVTLSNKVLEK